MEVNFAKNTVKKGDPGFQYDKRVKFDHKAEEALDNSWDESEDEDAGVEIVPAAGRNLSKPKGIGLQLNDKSDAEDSDDGANDN